MPVYSMTGYASVEGSLTSDEARPVVVGIEIRSVNSRFLDLVFKLPDDFRALEGRIREAVAARLDRGKVEVRVVTRRAPGEAGSLDGAALHSLRWSQEQIQNWLPDARSLSVAEVLALLRGQTAQEPACQWTPELAALLDEALAALKQARAAEGARLALVLQEKVSQLQELVAQARPLVPRLVEQQRNRFLERWSEAMREGSGQSGAVDAPELQQRAIAEATAFAIRVDVAEELSRLSAHLEEIVGLLDQGGVLGKRMDFLIQELHREANTFGSKSAMLESSRIGMEMKVLIEQMREQVQNIE